MTSPKGFSVKSHLLHVGLYFSILLCLSLFHCMICTSKYMCVCVHVCVCVCVCVCVYMYLYVCVHVCMCVCVCVCLYVYVRVYVCMYNGGSRGGGERGSARTPVSANFLMCKQFLSTFLCACAIYLVRVLMHPPPCSASVHYAMCMCSVAISHVA